MNFRIVRVFFLLALVMMANKLWAGVDPIAVDANENTTVSLFFPSAISKVIAPAVNFSFEYEPNGNLATLKAKKGNPSNLTVITADGAIFSFSVRYSESVVNFTYVISSEQAMGRREGTDYRAQNAEKAIPSSPESHRTTSEGNNSNSLLIADDNTTSDPMASESLSEQGEASDTTDYGLSEDNYVEKGSFYDMDREGYYQSFCENSYRQRSITKNNMRGNGGVDLRINHLAVDHNEIYFTMQFRNVSKSDYRIGNVRFYIQTLGNEELPMTPLYTFNREEYIKQSGVSKFVYVFKDFKLGPDQKVYVVMDEKGGQRNILLPLEMKKFLEDLE